ncbi:hypothetical protein Tco_0435807 [Tanacetum coccineum]
MKLIQKLRDDKKCMKKVEPSSRSKAIEDIVIIGSFVEALILNHYVLVRKIFIWRTSFLLSTTALASLIGSFDRIADSTIPVPLPLVRTYVFYNLKKMLSQNECSVPPELATHEASKMMPKSISHRPPRHNNGIKKVEIYIHEVEHRRAIGNIGDADMLQTVKMIQICLEDVRVHASSNKL